MIVMFDAHCPRCNAIRLLPISRLRSLVNSPLGIEVTLECYCGAVFELLLGQGPAASFPGAPAGPADVSGRMSPSHR
ncbi:MAG: hypothetical protein GEU81_06395 [Nitriliruptorales bacterium]|nr:hypothetical protein [Nitriliruptorales bacterium]